MRTFKIKNVEVDVTMKATQNDVNKLFGKDLNKKECEELHSKINKSGSNNTKQKDKKDS